MISPSRCDFAMEKRGAREVEAVSRLAFHGRNAPFDTPYTLAQGSHACGQRGARYRHRRGAIANRVSSARALWLPALPNRSCGRLGPRPCRRGGRRVWSEGVVPQKKQIGVHSGDACCRQGQTLVCTPDDTHHAACIAPRKINRPSAIASIGFIMQCSMLSTMKYIRGLGS